MCCRTRDGPNPVVLSRNAHHWSRGVWKSKCLAPTCWQLAVQDVLNLGAQNEAPSNSIRTLSGSGQYVRLGLFPLAFRGLRTDGVTCFAVLQDICYRTVCSSSSSLAHTPTSNTSSRLCHGQIFWEAAMDRTAEACAAKHAASVCKHRFAAVDRS